MKNEILTEALGLAEAILDDLYPDQEKIEWTVVNIALSENRKLIPPIDEISNSYGYLNNEAIELLQDLGIFVIGEKGKWFVTFVDPFNRYIEIKEAIITDEDKITQESHNVGYAVAEHSLYIEDKKDNFGKPRTDGLYAVLVNVKLLNKLVKKYDSNLDVLYKHWTYLSDQINDPVAFDTSKSVITIGKKSVPIKKDTNHFDLCKTILKSKSTKKKLWNYDELLEKWGGHYEDKNSWRKVYEAAREVNQKIAQEAQIKDFFILTTKTVQLNPKYL